MPITQVKNQRMADLTGGKIGDFIPMYAPANLNPQSYINAGTAIASIGTFSPGSAMGLLLDSQGQLAAAGAMYGLSNNSGPLAIKNTYATFDAAGNFVYGAMGTAAGYSGWEVQAAGGAYHTWTSGFGSTQYFGNLQINYNNIQAGINTQKAGGTLSVVPLGDF
jgi:hypothetical protein